MMLFNCRFFQNLISPGSIVLAYFVDPQKRDKIDERSVGATKVHREKKVNLNL